jgi:hypothetical protein
VVTKVAVTTKALRSIAFREALLIRTGLFAFYASSPRFKPRVES